MINSLYMQYPKQLTYADVFKNYLKLQKKYTTLDKLNKCIESGKIN